MKRRRFAVVDRDGTIIVERHYLSDPHQVELLPGVATGLRQLTEMGLGVVVVTNQSAIGRGFFDATRLDVIHQRLYELLEAEGVHLNGIYFCPHKPDDNCQCRKPHTDLIKLAARELNFDPQDSFVIGDKPCDIELGQRVGATTFLVRTGYGASVALQSARTQVTPEYVVDSVSDAVPVIECLLRGNGKNFCAMQLDIEQRRNRVRCHLLESAEVKRRIIDKCMNEILAASDLMADTFRLGGKVLLCGNGGSAADCTHMAAEFVNRLTKDFERPGLPAIALTTDTSFLTAYGNDCGFEGIFERQVQTLGKPGDVLIGISTSGNSPNVVRAVEAAREANMRTIVLTGSGGRLVAIADVAIAVPDTNTQYIQEAHLAIEHILCDLTERQLFSTNREEPIEKFILNPSV